MKKIFLLAFILCMPTLGFCSDHDHRLCNGIMPENDAWIGIGNKSTAGGITKEEFNEVIDKLLAIYKPIFKSKKKGTLKIKRKWKSGTVNAYASKFLFFSPKIAM